MRQRSPTAKLSQIVGDVSEAADATRKLEVAALCRHAGSGLLTGIKLLKGESTAKMLSAAEVNFDNESFWEVAGDEGAAECFIVESAQNVREPAFLRRRGRPVRGS